MIHTSGQIPLDLWSADWKIPAGHRIAVRVTDANTTGGCTCRRLGT